MDSGSPFEPLIGFARAVRVEERVYVSGTSPIWPDGSFDHDVAAQARRCLEIIVAALEELGASAADAVSDFLDPRWKVEIEAEAICAAE